MSYRSYNIRSMPKQTLFNYFRVSLCFSLFFFSFSHFSHLSKTLRVNYFKKFFFSLSFQQGWNVKMLCNNNNKCSMLQHTEQDHWNYFHCITSTFMVTLNMFWFFSNLLCSGLKLINISLAKPSGNSKENCISFCFIYFETT